MLKFARPAQRVWYGFVVHFVQHAFLSSNTDSLASVTEPVITAADWCSLQRYMCMLLPIMWCTQHQAAKAVPCMLYMLKPQRLVHNMAQSIEGKLQHQQARSLPETVCIV